MIEIEDFNNLVRTERQKLFRTPYDIVYDSFEKLEYNKKSSKDFETDASLMLENLRAECWDIFSKEEKLFTTKMLKEIIKYNQEIQNMNGLEAISEFVEHYPEHIYSLSLSNTQSRRSRAGKEFEAIIELLLMGADISIDSQGNIGKDLFIKKGLGKIVDLVSPGIIEYTLIKTRAVLISAKTSLRERWQEVPEEMARTGASKMYLVTLDTTISESVLKILYESNIIIVVTRNIKENHYPYNNNVI